jgi:hypothetical protein
MNVRHLQRLQTLLVWAALLIFFGPCIWIALQPNLISSSILLSLCFTLVVMGMFACFAVPTAVRLSIQVPYQDVAALELFLAARSETFAAVRKVIFGPMVGPEFRQRWRCYSVTCTTADGRQIIRRIALSEHPVTAAEMVRERAGSIWMPRIA